MGLIPRVPDSGVLREEWLRICCSSDKFLDDVDSDADAACSLLPENCWN